MRNFIKYDILNDIRTEKYYLEMELLRLVDIDDIPYKEKIHKIEKILKDIAINDSINSLVNEYFVDKEETKEKEKKE